MRPGNISFRRIGIYERRKHRSSLESISGFEGRYSDVSAIEVVHQMLKEADPTFENTIEDIRERTRTLIQS